MEPQLTLDDVVFDVVAHIRRLCNPPICSSNIIMMIATGVKYMDQYTSLSGADKKKIVINAIKDIIRHSHLSATDQQMLIVMLDSYGSETINYLVDFGKNQYLKIKKKCCS